MSDKKYYDDQLDKARQLQNGGQYAEANALLATNPHDPYFLELKGQILLEQGRPLDAIPVLREAVERSAL